MDQEERAQRFNGKDHSRDRGNPGIPFHGESLTRILFKHNTYACRSSQFESPLWAGHLPLRVGDPAGGSLTSDEYKFGVTCPLPIVVRHSILCHSISVSGLI